MGKIEMTFSTVEFPSRNTKNRIRSCATNVPSSPVSSSRISARNAFGLCGSGKWFHEYTTHKTVMKADSTSIGAAITYLAYMLLWFGDDDNSPLGLVASLAMTQVWHLMLLWGVVIGIGTRYTDFTTASNALIKTSGPPFMYLASNPASRKAMAVLQPTWNP